MNRIMAQESTRLGNSLQDTAQEYSGNAYGVAFSASSSQRTQRTRRDLNKDVLMPVRSAFSANSARKVGLSTDFRAGYSAVHRSQRGGLPHRNHRARDAARAPPRRRRGQSGQASPRQSVVRQDRDHS